MMAQRFLTDLDVALANAGIPYVEVGPSSLDPTGASSWRSRGRPPSTGSFEPEGVLCHHTASPAGTSDQSDLNVILAGNGSAPGPISQLYIGRTGTVYIVAAGRANHGGSGVRPGVDWGCSDMNARLVGIEAGNAGTGAEYWPDAQTAIYGRVVAALCDHYGWAIDSDVYLHATTGPPNGGCNSKIDPAGPWQRQPDIGGTWSLDVWRGWCAHQRQPQPPEPLPPLEGESMPAYITVGSAATFAMTGGFCTWISDPGDADRLGVPPPDEHGARGIWVTPRFMAGLILIGPMPPAEEGWNEGWFADWWPHGRPT